MCDHKVLVNIYTICSNLLGTNRSFSPWSDILIQRSARVMNGQAVCQICCNHQGPAACSTAELCSRGQWPLIHCCKDHHAAATQDHFQHDDKVMKSSCPICLQWGQSPLSILASVSHSVSVSPTSARVSHSGMQACQARARRWSFTQFFGEIEILLLTNYGALVVSCSPFFSLSKLSSLLSYRERYLRSAINPPGQLARREICPFSELDPGWCKGM